MEEKGGKKDNGMDLCTLMKERGIVSSRYILPLTNALREMNKSYVATSTEDLFKLFQEGAFSSSQDVEGDEDNFTRFLYTLSLLISDDVKKGLVARFHIPVMEEKGGNKENGMDLCTLMKERGIVSSRYISPLTNALREMNKSDVATSTEDLFKLFQEGTFSSSLDLEGDEDNFTRFLYTLSLLISDDVKKGLVARFHIPVMEEKGGNKENGMDLCTLMKERGIVSSRYISPLTNALREMNKSDVATSTEDLFKLFQEGTFSSLLDLEEDEDNFTRFLYTLSLLISDDVKKGLVARFHIPVMEEKGGNKENGMDLCTLMKERGIVSSRYISPLTNALREMNKSDVATSTEYLFKLFQEGTFSSLLDLEEDEETSRHWDRSVKGKTLHDGDKTRPLPQDREGQKGHALDDSSRQGERPSPEDVESIQTAVSTQAAQPMKPHAEENTQGNTQSIDDNVDHKDEVQDLETVPVDIVKELTLDFRPHQIANAMDTDDSTDEDEDLFSRAGGWECLEATTSTSQEGGLISIPNTEVELQIQPNSFLRDDEIHTITVKILPRRLFDESASCFEDHSTVMVEILPNNLKLQRAAKLTLPHCLILRDFKHCDVQIFHSHHDTDQLPQWEDITTSVQYELSANVCHIWIENFSWIKYDISGKEIEGKKLFLYTLGKRYTRNSKLVTAEVGYFPALPGNDRIKLQETDFITSSKGTRFESKLRKMFQGDWQTFVFWKEPKTSLAISVSEINPSDGWKSTSTCPKYISYQHVEISNEQSRPFIFQRQKDEAAFPVINFKVCQGEEYSEIYVDMEDGLIQDELHFVTDQNEKQQAQPMFEENDKYATTFGKKEVNTSKAISPVNMEAIKVRETALVVSSNNGGLIVRDELRKEITFQQQISPGSVQEINSQLQELPPISENSPQLQVNNSRKLMPIFLELSTNDIINLARLLDIRNPLMRDWRMLAGNLGFTDVDVENLARQNSPTRAVLHCACQSGALQSKGHLIKILEGMERIDAKNAILQ